MNGSLIQILIILLAIGGPVLGRALQAIDKKQKARRRQKDLEARELEALRTGRVTTQAPAAPPRPSGTTGPATPAGTATPGTARTATQRMQELAQKRQQQLEELRRRQRAAQQQQSTAGKSTTTTPRRPASRTQKGQTGRPAAKPPRRATPGVAAPRPLGEPVPQASGLPSAIHELAIDQHVLHPATEAPPAAATPLNLLGKQMSAEDWRRFIVARELLEPPLALRKGYGGSPL